MFLEKAIFLACIFQRKLAMLEAGGPTVCIFFCFELSDDVENLLSDGTEIKQVCFVLELLCFFNGDGIIFILLA